MNDALVMEGACMCGAVKVTVTDPRDHLHACHCDQCRAWTGSMFMSVSAADEQVKISGPIKTFRSSDWAERGWCDLCGSCVFYRTIGDGPTYYGVTAGLFPKSGGLPLTLEYYIDKKPAGYDFAGDNRRLNTAETEALFAPPEGDIS